MVMLKKEYLCNELFVDNIKIVLRQEYLNLNDLFIYNKLTIYVEKTLLKPIVWNYDMPIGVWSNSWRKFSDTRGLWQNNRWIEFNY